MEAPRLARARLPAGRRLPTRTQEHAAVSWCRLAADSFELRDDFDSVSDDDTSDIEDSDSSAARTSRSSRALVSYAARSMPLSAVHRSWRVTDIDLFQLMQVEMSLDDRSGVLRQLQRSCSRTLPVERPATSKNSGERI